MKRVVIRADVYGFCSGVRRAVELALEAGKRAGGGDVCTLGQLVHNPRVMEMLKNHKVRAIETPEQMSQGTVVIRAHGAPAATVESFAARGICVVDATCPKVARSHRIIESYAEKGYHVIVAGEREHDEVQGLVSRTNRATVVESAQEALAIECSGPVIVLAQTTFRSAEYRKICTVLQEKISDIEIFETVCPAMEERCGAVDRLAQRVDAIVIIGGKNSANTRRLFEQAGKSGLPAWYVQGADDLPDELFSFRRIGITAGASTPDYVVEEVEMRLQSGKEGDGVPRHGDAC